ncbi:MAG: PAS domain S-box protein [Planctomycetota bacterium]
MGDPFEAAAVHQSRSTRAGRDLFGDVFQALPTATVFVDTDFHCQAINPAAARLLGLDESDDGNRWIERLPSADRHRLLQWFSDLGQTGPASCEISVSLEQQVSRLRVQGRVTYDGEGDISGYVATFTEAPRSADAVAAHRLEAENRLLKSVARGIDLRAGLERFARFVEEQSSDILASILLFDESKQCLHQGAAPSLSKEFNAAIDGIFIGENSGACGAAAFRREMVIVEDVENDPLCARFRDLARRENIRACWSTPLFDTQGALLGTFAIYRHVPGGPTKDHRVLIETASSLASILLGRDKDAQQLELSQEQLRMTKFSVDSCSTSVFWLGSDAAFFYVNDAALDKFGYTRDELLSMTVHDIDPNYTTEVWPEYWRQVREQKSMTFESIMKKKDGHLIPVQITTNYLEYEGQEFVFAFVSDVSLQKDLYENSPYMMLSMDVATGSIRQCNETMVRTLGRNRAELIGSRTFDLLTPQSRRRVESDVFPKFLATGYIVDEPVQMLCADHAVRDFVLSATAVRNEEGRILASRSVLRDVTEQKRTESRLAESEALFRNLVQTAPFGVQRNDVYGRITFANPALGQIYGCPPEVLVGTSILDFTVNQPMRNEVREWLRRWVEYPQSTPSTYETVNRTMDGRIIDINVDWTYDFDADGSIIGFIVVITDITHRKRAERELAFRADVLDRVSDAVVVTDQQGSISYANEAAHRLYGGNDPMNGDVLISQRHRKLLEVAKVGDGVRTSLGETGVWEGEHELTLEDKHLWLETKLKAFSSPSGTKRLLLAVIRDISSRRMVEIENRRHRDLLAHVARLSTMGALVAGIAHEVKQPLHAISNYSTAASVALKTIEESFGAKIDQLESLNECNEGIRASSQRANEIIRRLRDFAKRGMQDRKPVDLNQVALDSVNLLAFKARETQIEVRYELAERLPKVTADRIQCEQVVVNLLNNAYESLEIDDQPRIVTVSTRIKGEWVDLSVRDNGPGIPPTTIGHLFDAFYTTKQDGMGMGLAISQTIVQDHGGRLTVEVDGEETVFTVALKHLGFDGK